MFFTCVFVCVSVWWRKHMDSDKVKPSFLILCFIVVLWTLLISGFTYMRSMSTVVAQQLCITWISHNQRPYRSGGQKGAMHFPEIRLQPEPPTWPCAINIRMNRVYSYWIVYGQQHWQVIKTLEGISSIKSLHLSWQNLHLLFRFIGLMHPAQFRIISRYSLCSI